MLSVSTSQSRRWTAYARVRVDRTSVDVEVVLREDLGALVDSLAGTIEDATKHVLRHAKLRSVAGELDPGLKTS